MPVDDNRATRRILIVDDIEDNCVLIEDHLRRKLKCEFRKASSGKEALNMERTGIFLWLKTTPGIEAP